MVTDDDDVARLARRLRFHGSDDKKTFVEVGYNSRLDELQAAVLRILLPELDGWNAARRAAAAAYERHGLGEHVELPRPVEGAEHVYHLYVVRSERADELAGRAGRARRRRARLLPRARAPPAGHGPVRRAPSCPAPTRRPAPAWRCRWAPASPTRRSARWSRRARLGRPDQLPPRARHAPADRRDARGRARGGGHRARLRPDAGAVRALRHRAHGDRPPPRRAAGEQGAGAGQPQRGARALGARAPLRRGDGPRLQRRDGGGRAAARPERHGVRLRVGHGRSTT